MVLLSATAQGPVEDPEGERSPLRRALAILCGSTFRRLTHGRPA